MSSERHLQKQRDKLQKLYDLLDDKVLHFRTAMVTERDYAVLFKLDRDIEEAEAQRSQVKQDIDRLDGVLGNEELYRALLKLGYREQVYSFGRFIKAQSIGAFLIHGLPDHGQRWLLNRLLKPYSTKGKKVIPVKLNCIARRRDINALWRELAGRVGLGRQQPQSEAEIVKRVYQWWRTQHVILIFHDADCMPEAYLHEFIDKFWLPLASEARKSISQAHNFQLLMFLVDSEGCVGTRETLFIEKLDPTWEPRIPIRLPTINSFSNSDLINWIETIESESEFDVSPIEVINKINDKINDPVQFILENSDNGVPELVLAEICDLCDCNWYEAQDKWLIH